MHTHTHTHTQSVNLKGSAIELLEAMLERTDKKTKKLVQEIAEGLDIDNLHGLLAQFSAWKDDRNVQRQGFDDEAEQGMFRTYHVLVHLTDYGVPAKKVGTLIHPGSVIDARQLNDHIGPLCKSIFCNELIMLF